jgi:glycine/D-amino acid oxidase-like deaminating enzyme
VPVSSSVVTTEPLPDALLARILPQRHVVSDTRHLLNYFRVGPGNRLLYGGRGSLTGKESPELYSGLERKLVETYPALSGVAIDHRWSGKVAVTLDDFPHAGRVSLFAEHDAGRFHELRPAHGVFLYELREIGA